MTHITRGSSADREMRCAGGIGWDGAGSDVDDSDGPAKLGTATGDGVEAYAVDGELVDLDDLARKYDVDRNQLSMAVHGGRKAWDEIHQWFPGVQSQVRVDGITTNGTADLMSVVMVGDVLDRLSVADVKLGMTDDRHENQLKSYALAKIDEVGSFPRDGYVTGVEIHCMPQLRFVHKWTEDDLENFRAKLQLQHTLAGKRFSPGDWCKYCPRRLACGPRDEYLRASASALVKIDSHAISTREALAAAYQASVEVARLKRVYDKALRIALQDGPLTLPDGRILQLVDEERSVLDPAIALDELRKAGADAMVAVSVSKASVGRAIKEIAPPRKGAPMERALLKAIEDRGGVSTKTIQTTKATTP